MADNDFDVVVIGGGPGGYVCAIRCAQLGLKTACVDDRPELGGTCLNVGCIPSKALLESSEIYHQAQGVFARHGVKVQAELDLPTMMQRKEKIVSALTRGVAGLFKKNGITRLQGRGRFKTAHEIEIVEAGASEASQAVTARHVVVATGSEPASLRGVAFDGQKVFTSTEALSLPAPPKHLAVIGAGVIGLEMGSVWRRLGAEVTVLEYLDRVLPGADAEVSKQARTSLSKQGLHFQLGVAVKGTEVRGDTVEVTYQKGDATEQLACDAVLVAVGRRPYTAGLGAEAVGLALDDRGRVKVDGALKTNLEDVWALGDVVEGPMLAHKAEDEGVAVAERIAGLPGHVSYGAIPFVVYTDPEVAWVGQTEDALKEAGVPYRVGKFPFMANGRAKALESTEGFVKILAAAETDRVLGVHIVGFKAGELIAEGVLGLELGASAEDIARTCHAHPTLTEVFREAALAVDKRAIHI